MPTLPETTGEPDVVEDVPPPNAVGSTPTELVTTGGGGAVDVAGDDDAPGRIDIDVDDAGAGGVRLRLSLTTGTRTLCVSAVAADWVACRGEVPGGLKTRGDADACDACDFEGLAGTAEGTRSTGKRRGTTLRACREWTRGGGARRAAMMNGAA
jgi:hypothetical protein